MKMYFFEIFQVSDSSVVMMLRSFGLIGLVIYIFIFSYLHLKCGMNAFFLYVIFLFYNSAQSLPEQHPTFILMAIALNYLKKVNLYKKENQQRNIEYNN